MTRQEWLPQLSAPSRGTHHGDDSGMLSWTFRRGGAHPCNLHLVFHFKSPRRWEVYKEMDHRPHPNLWPRLNRASPLLRSRLSPAGMAAATFAALNPLRKETAYDHD